MAAEKRQKTSSQYKTSMILSIILALVLLVFTVVYVGMNFNYMVLGKSIDLNQQLREGKSPEKGDLVTFEVRYVLGNFAETKHKINGIIPTGTDEHYVVVLDDNSLMAVSVSGSKDVDAMNKLESETKAYLADTDDISKIPTSTIKLTGRLETMHSEIQKYYNQALSTLSTYTIHNMTLNATHGRLSMFMITFFLLALLVVFIFSAIQSKKKMKKVAEVQAIARQNAADPSLNPFLTGYQNSPNPAVPGAATGNEAANPFINADPANPSGPMPGSEPTGPVMNSEPTGPVQSNDPMSPVQGSESTGTILNGEPVDPTQDPFRNPYDNV